MYFLCLQSMNINTHIQDKLAILFIFKLKPVCKAGPYRF